MSKHTPKPQTKRQLAARRANIKKAQAALRAKYGTASIAKINAERGTTRRRNPESRAERSAAAERGWEHRRERNPGASVGAMLEALLGMVIGGAVAAAEAAALNHYQVLSPPWRGVIVGGTDMVIGGIAGLWFPVIGASIGGAGLATGVTVALSGPPAKAKATSSTTTGAVDYDPMGAVQYDPMGNVVSVDPFAMN